MPCRNLPKLLRNALRKSACINMDSQEYRAALEELGLTQQAAAKFLGVNAVTARKWAAKKGHMTKAGVSIPPGPPEPVAKYLNHLIAMKKMLRILESQTCYQEWKLTEIGKLFYAFDKAANAAWECESVTREAFLTVLKRMLP